MIKSGFALRVIGNYEDFVKTHSYFEPLNPDDDVKEKLHKQFSFVVNESFDQVDSGEAFSYEKDGYLLPIACRDKINIIVDKFFGNQDKTVWENKESAKKASEDLYSVISNYIDVHFLPKKPTKPTKSATMKN